MADAQGKARSPFAPNCIDTEQIFDACINHQKLADDSVETHNIKALNVTSDKLAAGLLTNGTRQCLAYAEVVCTANATVPIGTIPSGSMITDVIVAASTAINGNGTEDIGDAGDHDGLMATANITKTLDAISGEDPATRGEYLWVAGVQGGVDPFAVTTYAHPRRKWVVDDTIYNAYITKGTNTTGVIRVYIFYERGVMSG